MSAPGKAVRRSPGTVLLNAPYLLWAALFIIIPLFLVLYYALIDGDGNPNQFLFKVSAFQVGCNLFHPRFGRNARKI